MSLRETRAFLQDLVLRFDPEQDITEGSRADAELIQPILDRIGPDPFDEDIHVFVRERIRQAFPERAITEVDEYVDILIDPFRVLCEPLVREVKLAKLRSSLKNAESLSDDEVDALMANFFKPRLAGGFATGVVRAFFSSPQTISVSQPHIASTRAGLQFIPTRPQGITQDQMALNILGSEYYFDINYTARNRGDEYNVEASEVVSIANLPTAIRVRNLRRFRNGTPQEDNPEYIGRVERSISDGTLTAERGIISTLTEAFPDIRSILVVGFHDPEMLRDIVRGGSLGAIPSDDSLGSFFGVGTATDDQDGDLSTQLLDATDGHFVTRVAAAGDAPTSWYVTLFYTSASVLVVADVQIEEVVSDTRVRLDHEIPLDATGLGWALRERKIAISDIPGGITLPDTAEGTLEIADDSIHIGGKVDIYIGGETELGTASITSLTDESPIAKGYGAFTQGSVSGDEAIVLLADLGVSLDLIEPGMSLVLEEGEDVNSYRILEVMPGSPDGVRVDQDMTGTQSGITWKIVDDIDIELTDPKNIKAEGADLITAAGASSVTTSGGFNFLDGDIAEGDILEITAERGGGEFTITEVTATALFVEPVTPRTIGAASWRVFSRSEAVETPVVRVSALELLDAVGAPNGTKIPYRDPVLVHSRAFQNEGQGFAYDNLTRTGIVSVGLSTGSVFLSGGQTIMWELRNRESVWEIAAGGDSGTFTFTAGPKTAAQLVAEVNADATLHAKGIKAQVLTSADGDQEYVGFLAARRLRFVGGTALVPLNLFLGISNSTIISAAPGTMSFLQAAVRLGDLVEVVSGPNSGVTSRVVSTPFSTGYGTIAVTLGDGPISPAGYDLAVLAPSVEARARVGRPSFGSARVFFLDPTSAEFHYRDARFSIEVDGRELEYRPDPENSRQVLPAVPSEETQGPAALDLVSVSKTLTDTDADFLRLDIRPGDLLDVLFSRIEGTGPMASPGTVAVGGKTLRIRIEDGPWVSINFPFDMSRQDVADYINTSLGADVATLSSGVLHLIYRERLEIDPTSTAITSGDPLLLSGVSSFSTDNSAAGTYTVAAVSATILTLSPLTASGTAPSTTYYRVRRYVQRISSTEMNTQVDASGLYYTDVQLVSLGPGDDYNIQSELDLGVTGYISDGYRLSTENSVLSFSRAEVLYAEISKSILLVGSSDSPEEYVQLSQQNVQVTYDRSALVDAAQSFVDARFNRVVCSEPLVRHLQPHYVSMVWNYIAGPTEAEGVRLLTDYLATIEVDDGLEVNDLTNVLRRKNATSVYTADTSASSGRSAPIMVVVYHSVDRAVRAVVVSDVVDTVRTQRFMPGAITLRRVSPGGIR